MKNFMGSLKNIYLDIIVGIIVNILWIVIVLFAKPIVEKEVSFSLSILLILAFIIVTLAILYFRKFVQSKCYLKEIEDLKNPVNSKVAEFKLGDQVIRKIDETMIIPKPFSVYKIESNKVYCRNENDVIKDYAPDELYTAEETKWIINRKEAERRRIEEENQSQWNNIFGNW